jgi:hypothetical protein
MTYDWRGSDYVDGLALSPYLPDDVRVMTDKSEPPV